MADAISLPNPSMPRELFSFHLPNPAELLGGEITFSGRGKLALGVELGGVPAAFLVFSALKALRI
jgi:hypothetical protein